MAPKGAPPPEPAADEGPPEPDPWETHEVVCGVIDGIVGDAFAAVAEKACNAAVVPYVVSAIEADLHKMLKFKFMDYDVGEPAGAANWAPGGEPTPCPIDSWSRGAVPAKQLPPPPAAPEPSESLPPKSPRARTSSAAPSSAPPPSALQKEPMFVARPPPGYEPPKPKKSAPIVTAAEKKAKRLDAEAREERERLERLKADLKGREYTYDARGNIIVMEGMQADRLPAFQNQPRLGLAQEKVARSKKKGVGAAGGKGARIEFGSTASFKQLDSLQPPVTETMLVEAGVLLKQGESSKGGEPREFEGERITKAQFDALANSTGGFSERRTIGGDAAASGRDPALGNSGGAEPVPPTPMKPPANANPLGEVSSPAVRPGSIPDSPPHPTGMRNPSTRERGGMPTKNKLPPPSLGATTGHGQALPYENRPLPSIR